MASTQEPQAVDSAAGAAAGEVAEMQQPSAPATGVEADPQGAQGKPMETDASDKKEAAEKEAHHCHATASSGAADAEENETAQAGKDGADKEAQASEEPTMAKASAEEAAVEEQEPSKMEVDSKAQAMEEPTEAKASAEEAAVEEQEPSKMDVDNKAPDAQQPTTPEKSESVPKAQATTRAGRANLKRKRGVEVLAKKAEMLEDEAGQAENATRDLVAAREKLVLDMRQLDGKIQKQKEVATAAQRAVDRARQEVALHDVPKGRDKPLAPFNHFIKDVRPTLTQEQAGSQGSLKKMAQMWADLPEEQKKKYRDVFEAEKKEYAAWASSEEGRNVLAQRSDALKGRAASGGRTSAVSAPAGGTPESKTTPSKEPKPAASKQRRTIPAPSKPADPAAASPGLEAVIMEEADKLSLRAQLLNLAGRPDVQALKKSPQQLLEVLAANSGMVNAAKRQLMAEAES